jgi:soluble lytic murein transglycosylase-like protein
MTVMLMSSVIHLSQQKKENTETIGRLNDSVVRLQSRLAAYEKEKEKFGFYKFKDNVFNLKYPGFSQVTGIVYRKSKEYGFSPYVIMALIQVESNFEQYAVSTVGACGLMQINFPVWKDIYDIDYNRVFEKEYNIDLGLKILKRYYKKTSGNLLKALFHYNNGYKYNNVKYTANVIKTKFYTHGQEAGKEKVEEDKNVSI